MIEKIKRNTAQGLVFRAISRRPCISVNAITTGTVSKINVAAPSDSHGQRSIPVVATVMNSA